MASLKLALPIGSAISLLVGLGLQLVLPQEPLVGWALIGLAAALAMFWGGMLAARRWSGVEEQGSIVMHNPTFYIDQVREEIAAVSISPVACPSRPLDRQRYDYAPFCNLSRHGNLAADFHADS